MRYMQLRLILITFISFPIKAVESCTEHDHCKPQGMLQVIVSPQVKEEYIKFCNGASFIVNFNLLDGKPKDVSVLSGHKGLRPSIAKSFKQWRYGSIGKIKNVKEKINLNHDCSVKEKEIPWK